MDKDIKLKSPLRELRHGFQVVRWLEEWGGRLEKSAEMILIGSAALLWHGAQQDPSISLPEASMDVDPITDNEEVALLAYECLIGSDFELQHGWHVNLMPQSVLKEFPDDWKQRAVQKVYGKLTVLIPSVKDLLLPKIKRNEPRDRMHAHWAKEKGLF